ncbi:MAG TPA: L-serine ammonia-lyase, iron-sulfur-dependent, subunit alpha [Synergistaceae bacterium]|nr:L-serine ammonia-lyase, iron-sulfur-dependent, subunit alpha [Synergistaceae bacterium]
MCAQERLVSLFDILGPIMTGPSSSHTAGVLRIGRIGRLLLGGEPEAIVLHFYGNALGRTYKGHLSDSAIVAGLLGYEEDSPIVRTALQEAARRNVPVTYHVAYDSERNPNTVDMRLSRQGKELRVVGITVGGGEIMMTEVDGFAIALSGCEEGFLLETDGAFDAATMESLFRGRLTAVRRSESDGRTLWTCLMGQAPSDGDMEALRTMGGVRRIFPLQAILDRKTDDARALFTSFDEMFRVMEDKKLSLPQAAMEYERCQSGLSDEEIRRRMERIWAVMKESIQLGISGDNDMVAGFIPRDSGARLMRAVNEGKTVGGKTLGTAVARAIATMETNACARCVVAAPTAGSCGVLPGALTTVAEERNASDDAVVDALLSAAISGVLVAMRASLSGSIGGCQAEIGVASAMTAAALVQLAGGTPRQVAHGMALAMKNILGLICDPVAGPVEIPCIKRNGIGVGNAFAAADMALAGVESAIPPDEVIGALANTQKLLPSELRGTMIGGLGSTPTAIRLKEEWNQRIFAMARDGK